MGQSLKDRLKVLWEEQKWAEFDRLYQMGKWMLPKEDQEKIQIALNKRNGIWKQQQSNSVQNSLLDIPIE